MQLLKYKINSGIVFCISTFILVVLLLTNKNIIWVGIFGTISGVSFCICTGLNIYEWYKVREGKTFVQTIDLDKYNGELPSTLNVEYNTPTYYYINNMDTHQTQCDECKNDVECRTKHDNVQNQQVENKLKHQNSGYVQYDDKTKYYHFDCAIRLLKIYSV
jgi:hypothetical protein